MKRILSIAALVLLLPMNSLSQIDGNIGGEPESHFSSFWDFYAENDLGVRVWGMGGAGVANVSDLSAMVVNPAALDLDRKFEVYCEFLSKTKNRWLGELVKGVYLKFPLVLPAFIGVGYKINDQIAIGWGFCSPKYYKLDLGISVRTDEYGNVIGKSHNYDVFKIRQILFPLSFKLNENCFFGGNVSYNFVSLSTHLEEKKGRSEVEYFDLKLGLLLKLTENFDLGITFVPERKFKTETVWKDEYTSFGEKFGTTIYPQKFEAGIKLHHLSFPIDFAADIKYSKNSRAKYLEDRFDYHLGMEIKNFKNIAFQLGYFTRFDFRDPDVEWAEKIGKYDQHFLTAGATFNKGRVSFQGSVRDSHLLSSGLIKQTHLSFGIGLSF
jgi:hypothetical protein